MIQRIYVVMAQGGDCPSEFFEYSVAAFTTEDEANCHCILAIAKSLEIWREYRDSPPLPPLPPQLQNPYDPYYRHLDGPNDYTVESILLVAELGW